MCGRIENMIAKATKKTFGTKENRNRDPSNESEQERSEKNNQRSKLQTKTMIVGIMCRCCCSITLCVCVRLCECTILSTLLFIKCRSRQCSIHRWISNQVESRVIAFTGCCCCCVQHFVHYARCTMLVLVRNAYDSNVNKIETKLIIVTHSLAHSSNFSFWLHLEKRKRKTKFRCFD